MQTKSRAQEPAVEWTVEKECQMLQISEVYGKEQSSNPAENIEEHVYVAALLASNGEDSSCINSAAIRHMTVCRKPFSYLKNQVAIQ